MLKKIFLVRLIPKDKTTFIEVVHIDMKLTTEMMGETLEDVDAVITYLETHYPSLEIDNIIQGYTQG